MDLFDGSSLWNIDEKALLIQYNFKDLLLVKEIFIGYFSTVLITIFN